MIEGGEYAGKVIVFQNKEGLLNINCNIPYNFNVVKKY